MGSDKLQNDTKQTIHPCVDYHKNTNKQSVDSQVLGRLLKNDTIKASQEMYHRKYITPSMIL
jgi:hypothetical protein